MADTLKVGDLVKLKSGGPVMTVSAVSTVDSQTTVECIWFDDDGDNREADFPAEALKECG
jgi:uncharacterized protein YodC (DUF2158 family)